MTEGEVRDLLDELGPENQELHTREQLVDALFVCRSMIREAERDSEINRKRREEVKRLHADANAKATEKTA